MYVTRRTSADVPKVALECLRVLSDQTQAAGASAGEARAWTTAAKLPRSYLSVYCIRSVWLIMLLLLFFLLLILQKNKHSSMSQSVSFVNKSNVRYIKEI